MALTFSKQPECTRDRPSLTSKQAEDYTGGAITYDFLKRDRLVAEANGTAPMVPYYKLGHRTIKYRPSDIDTFLEQSRVG